MMACTSGRASQPASSGQRGGEPPLLQLPLRLRGGRFACLQHSAAGVPGLLLPPQHHRRACSRAACAPSRAGADRAALAALLAETAAEVARYRAAHPEVLVTSAAAGSGIERLRALLAALALPAPRR